MKRKLSSNLVNILFLICIFCLMASCEKPDDSSLVDTIEVVTLKNGVPASAHVLFGDENAGTDFFPPGSHDASFHAKDKMVPRTVVIAAGGEVHYEIAPVHQVAIYAPGTKPNDIDISLTEDFVLPFFPFIVPDFIINDPNDRVALSPPTELEHTTWTSPAGTFDTPGKYFVICSTTPHFVNGKMYGWVIVK